MFDLVDSEAIRRIFWDYLQIVLLHPESARIFIIAFLTAFLSITICLAQVHNLGNSARGSLFAGLLVTTVCSIGLLGTATLANRYVLPLVNNPDLNITIVNGCVIAAFLLMIVPFTRALFRASYATSLGSWVIALLVALVLVYGVHTVVKPRYNDKPATPAAVEKNLEDAKKKIHF